MSMKDGDKPIYYFGVRPVDEFSKLEVRCVTRRNSGGSAAVSSTDSDGESENSSLEQWKPTDAHIHLMRKLHQQLLSHPQVSWNPRCDDSSSHISCDGSTSEESESSFGGIKDILDRDPYSTIRSGKGTVRGVRNRVRAGIATFLQDPLAKVIYEKEHGRLVLYTTSMGIVRDTFTQCLKVRRILKTLLVKFEERDVYLSSHHQEEVRRRLGCDNVTVPMPTL